MLGGLQILLELDLPQHSPLHPRTERNVLRGPAGAGLNQPPPTEYGCQSGSVGKFVSHPDGSDVFKIIQDFIK